MDQPGKHLLLVGSGYLGRAVAEAFADHGWSVTSLSLNGGGGSIACDVGNPSDVTATARGIARPDVIIHCAASGHGGPDAYRHVYLQGMRNLLDAFPDSHPLFTSSSSVYAQTDGSVVTEESPAQPDRETGRILIETELAVLARNGTAARLAGIYGPHRSVLLKKFLDGSAVIEDDGNRYINQIHRDDAAAALLHLATLRLSGIYNVADGDPLRQCECYVGLARLFSRPLPPSGPRNPDRKRGWTHKQVSHAKLATTGWSPRFPRFLDAAQEIAATLLP